MQTITEKICLLKKKILYLRALFFIKLLYLEASIESSHTNTRFRPFQKKESFIMLLQFYYKCNCFFAFDRFYIADCFSDFTTSQNKNLNSASNFIPPPRFQFYQLYSLILKAIFDLEIFTPELFQVKNQLLGNREAITQLLGETICLILQILIYQILYCLLYNIFCLH